jgi:pantothenate kinase
MRRIIGLAGAPGAGKSTYAERLAAAMRDRGRTVAVVPLDGFHLADRVLVEHGTLDRKGAPETFDPHGYAALLHRLRTARETVFAPAFERELEQPLAGAIEISAGVDLVITEGNYLLLDAPGWRSARASIDEVWFVDPPDEHVRTERLVARHIRFGKTPAEAAAWVARVDAPNAGLVDASRCRADRVVGGDEPISG